MQPFGLRFLEKVGADQVVSVGEWTWKPKSSETLRIYASGNSTRSRESTYAAEKDDRMDEDRPNEGLAA